ncbi:hypothetical protein JTB14_007596 [Gonioctena quinquepunctata]|nr:hypothetical protein JTB14_007596 [Gonioctena quinquepunctata]
MDQFKTSHSEDFDLEEYLSVEKKVKKNSSEDSSVINSHNVLKQVQEDPTIPIIEINYFEDVPLYEVPPHTLLEVNSGDFITAEVISNLVSELKFIQEKINYEKTTIINVCRDNTVAGTSRALERSPYNKSDVVFVDFEDTPEGAIDGVGPTQELWRLALQDLKCSNIFTECVFPNLEDIGGSEYLTEISAVAASANLEDLRIAISKSSILLEIGISPLITTFDEKDPVLKDGDCKVSLEDLLAFATGANKIPALDFPMTPAIQFLHEDSHFPKANRGALILFLQLTEQEFDKFVDNMDFAILNSLPAFGFA